VTPAKIYVRFALKATELLRGSEMTDESQRSERPTSSDVLPTKA
jgi:hypothetical protein